MKNREIKFRALHVLSEIMVYGHYYENNSKSYICSEDHSDNADSYYNYEIIYESLGQLTGIKDKNGKEIYEGDIIKFTTYSESGITEKDHTPVSIRWNNYKSTYDFYDNKYRCLGDYPFFHYWTLENMRNEEYEVIGNIYENPEPLNG